MSGEVPHFGFGHGCDQCEFALDLHTGCIQLDSVLPAESVAPTETATSVEPAAPAETTQSTT